MAAILECPTQTHGIFKRCALGVGRGSGRDLIMRFSATLLACALYVIGIRQSLLLAFG